MAKSIKINFIFNIINTVSSLLFPLFAFSYASRILYAQGIGEVQFFQSIINYVILFTSLGIPMYGIREIARVRDNPELLSQTTIEIIVLNLLLNIVGYIAVVIICLFVAKVQANILLFLILSSSIVLTTIGCSWFYNGIEDFKYITLLGLIVKTISLLFLFLFVKTSSDILIYGIYTILGSVGCNIVNFLRLGKYVRFSFGHLNIKRHVKPTCEIFLFNIVTSIYINLDTVMLGFLKNNISVGFYTAATKVSHILVTLITSFGAVLLPRSSNLIKNKQYEEFYSLSYKSYKMVVFLAFPLCAGVFACSPQLIKLFCGNAFYPAILTLRIVSPIIIALGISNLIGIQVLYPLGKIKMVTVSTCVGASINVVLNFILIPRYSQDGAAIATLFAEWGVTLTQCYLVRKILPFNVFNIDFVKYLFCSLLMLFLCIMLGDTFENIFLDLLFVVVVGILFYAILMVFSKDKLFKEVFHLLIKK